MKKLAVISVLLLLVAGAAYWAYQDPKVRSLFSTSSEKPEDPLDFLEDLPEIQPTQEPLPSDRATTRRQAPEPPAQQESQAAQPVAPQNQVPNDEVARVLVQILTAKGLASGVNLAVTDEAVVLTGEVASQDRRQAIIDTVEKGREAREIDASGLTVAAP